MLERDIRAALKKRVHQYGGEVRAVAWLGRRNAPDALCLFPKLSLGSLWGHPFVETKAPKGVPTAAQAREHKYLRSAGFEVIVISTLETLDEWLPPL